MMAVLGATEDEVTEAVSRASGHGVVVISNFNAPTQHVIAGERAAVDAAAAWLEETCGASTVETESRVPMHSPAPARRSPGARPSSARSTRASSSG